MNLVDCFILTSKDPERKIIACIHYLWAIRLRRMPKFFSFPFQYRFFPFKKLRHNLNAIKHTNFKCTTKWRNFTYFYLPSYQYLGHDTEHFCHCRKQLSVEYWPTSTQLLFWLHRWFCLSWILYKWDHKVLLRVWFLCLRIVFSKFTYVVTCIISWFSFISE